MNEIMLHPESTIGNDSNIWQPINDLLTYHQQVYNCLNECLNIMADSWLYDLPISKDQYTEVFEKFENAKKFKNYAFGD